MHHTSSASQDGWAWTWSVIFGHRGSVAPHCSELLTHVFFSFHCVWCSFCVRVQCVSFKNTDTYPPLFPGAVWSVCFVFLTLRHPNSQLHHSSSLQQTLCVSERLAGGRERVIEQHSITVYGGAEEKQRHEQLSETQQRRHGMITSGKTTLSV